MTLAGHLAPSRSSRRERVRYVALFAASFLFIAAVTLGMLRLVDEPSYGYAVALPLLAGLAVVMFTIPVHMIPALLIAVIAIVPTRLIPSSGPFVALPVLAIAMGVWVLRRWLAQRGPRFAQLPSLTAIGPRLAVYTTAVLLVGWLLVSTWRTSNMETSLGWTMAFVVSAILPLLVFDAREEVALLRTVLLIVGAFAGVNIMIEMLIGTSPVYGILAGLFTGQREFGFAVYRARGPFSHPLFAGAFLTIPALLGIGTWLTTGRRLPLLAGLLAAAGVLGTVSRSSILALGVGVGVAVLVAPFFLGRARLNRWFALLGLTIVGGIGVLNFGPLLERSDSIESALSASVRDRAIDIAIDGANYSNWLGTGPGTSGQTGRLFDSIVIENSLLQLLLSIGIPGLALFVLFIGSLVWCAWARGDLGAGIAVIGYMVAIAGFNSIDAVRIMHILIGMLVLFAVQDAEAARRTPKSALVEPRAPARV